MTLSEIRETKRTAILDLAARWGVKSVNIFGSVARGRAGPESDVDVLVEMEPGRSLFDMGGFLMDMQELLGCKVDVVTENGLKARIRERVLREAVPL